MADIINEVTEEVLEGVAGGSTPVTPRQPINLTGVYWVDSAMSGPAYNLAIGWPNLFVQMYSAGKAPFLVTQLINGRYSSIGWTVVGNFTPRAL